MEAQSAVVVADRRLGKRPSKFDQRTLRLAKYVSKKALKAPPKTQNRMARVVASGGYPMHMNDTLGICTCASLAHAQATFRVWGKKATTHEPDATVLDWYRRWCGYDGSPATDNGGFLLDVLKAARKEGVIHAYVALDPANEAELKYAVHVFGGVYAGVMLPVSAQEEAVWTRTSGVGSEPWSWGGHAIYVGRYTTTRWTCATWGALQDMTYEWRDRYMDEAFAVLDDDWIRDNGKSVTGLDLATLESDLQAVINL